MNSDKQDKPCRLVILISGSGTNLQAFIDAIAEQRLAATIAAVVSNKSTAKGLHRAASAGIETVTVEHAKFESRQAFDAELAKTIDSFQPDLLILAGFMRILTPEFVTCYEGKLLNIHPSLLPKYPGLHTHRRAIEAGDTEAGSSVHFVTSELDGGPIIIQAAVPIETEDDENSLAQRVLVQEHIIYPKVAHWFALGRLKLQGDKVLLDNAVLPINGYQD